MSNKIQKIQIENLKKVPFESLDLNGCSVIVTGSNDKGKSTILRTFIDRIRGEKPDMIVTQGEEEGKSFMVLTSGERFEWEYNVKGKDKLTLITAKSHRINVTQAIGAEYFPPSFDIDAFMKAQPKQQGITLQKLVGLDFSEVDQEYKLAYDARTLANSLAASEKVRLMGMDQNLEFVAPVDTKALLAQKEEIRARLNAKYQENVTANAAMRNNYETERAEIRLRLDALYQQNVITNNQMRRAWEQENENLKKDVEDFNKQQDDIRANIKKINTCIEMLRELGYTGMEVSQYATSLMNSLTENKTFVPLPHPDWIDPEKPDDTEYTSYPEPKWITPEMPDDAELVAIDKEIANAASTNQRAQDYKNLTEQKEKAKTAADAAKEADDRVKAAELAKAEMIKSAKLPEGIAFAEDGGITIDGFPLSDAQISSSKKYIAALKLGKLTLGDVSTLYFDASYLDHANYNAVQKWADENGLQLLVEKATWEEQERRYEIIQSIS